MKVAAIALDAVFADPAATLPHAEGLVRAAEQGAALVLLPEFFPSAIGFSPAMLAVAPQGERVRHWMRRIAAELNIVLGGSYLCWDGMHARNRFELMFPDGQAFAHCKDLPTQWEGCYYREGDEQHLLDTPLGRIGVALCWEMLRTDTLRRLAGQADFVLAASCWWDLPEDAPPGRAAMRAQNQSLARETPARFARMLGVPVVHACHCGTVRAPRFPQGGRAETRRLVGAAQIVGPDGRPLALREFREGPGFALAELPPPVPLPALAIPAGYWAQPLPAEYLRAWDVTALPAREYYHAVALPAYRRCCGA